MKIAVVGTGVSGLVCSRLLVNQHEVTVFESSDKIGGHVNTVSVQMDDEKREHQVDTGFIVYNERTYPNFTRILADLKAATKPTSMSFSVRCDRTGLEYNGTSLNGVFAQRSNLFRPSYLRLLRDILRFGREGFAEKDCISETQTVAEYVREKGYSAQFSEQYLLPMGAAIWSCPQKDFQQFPIQFILQFYANHGLLSLRDRPVWRVITGGARVYAERLAKPFVDRIRLDCPVQAVQRSDDGVLVRHSQGSERFDEIVFACHSDQALKLLEDADSLERELLSAFPYGENTAVLHTDESVLPKKRRAWAAWNYHLTNAEEQRPTVTYNMNILQGIQSKRTFCVTLNEPDCVDANKIIASFRYAHPLFTTSRAARQKRHAEVIRRRRTSFCGAYWRNGFHEDGVVSALAVCKKFGIPEWTTRITQQADFGSRRHNASRPLAPSTSGA